MPVSIHEDYQRNGKVLKYTNSNFTMAQFLHNDIPPDFTRILESSLDAMQKEYLQKDALAMSYKKQLEEKEQKKEKDLKNLIAYYYRK